MSLIDRNLGTRWRQMRFNPLRSLTPAALAAALDEFDAGYLRRAALLFEAIGDRDDTLKTVLPKRRKAVSRRPWNVLTVADSREAKRHAETLKYFYNHLTATNAIDGNVRGGFSLLVRQMMTAQEMRYGCHEVIWQPAGDGRLTAEFKFVPLYFFENRTGDLRYIGPEGLTDGAALEENGWMITCGDGLMPALAICYMFKRLSLQDWVAFSEKFGIPGIHGETAAAPGSKEYDDFCNALAEFASDFVAVSAAGTKINLIEAKAGGDAPFAPMVELMSRSMVALVRGADLGTLSSKDGAGASLQDEEADLLLEDDCELIAETLTTQISRFVIRTVHGPVEPLAYLNIEPPVRQDVKTDIEVDRFLLEVGGELDAAETFERYGREMPRAVEKGATLKKAAPAPQPGAEEAPDPAEAAANDAAARVAEALGVDADWLAPLAGVFADLVAATGEADQIPALRVIAALEEAQRGLPEIFASMDLAAFTDTLEPALGAAALEGAREGLRTKQKAA